MTFSLMTFGPRVVPLTSALQLVGTPYVRGGVTPEIGFDCYTLMAYVRWHWFERTTPFAGIPARKLSPMQACALGIRRALGMRVEALTPWHAIQTPIAGCAVALGHMRLGRGRLHHCGVWIEGGVLHAMEMLGVCWTPSERLPALFARMEFYECVPV
jgi:hypothetical protein